MLENIKKLELLKSKESLLFISVANLCSEKGFERFRKQKEFKVAGFYCMHIILLPYFHNIYIYSYEPRYCEKDSRREWVCNNKKFN